MKPRCGRKARKGYLLRSLRHSERNKSLAEEGWGVGLLLESLTRMDSEDWKMQRKKPRTNVRPIDFIQLWSACSIMFDMDEAVDRCRVLVVVGLLAVWDEVWMGGGEARKKDGEKDGGVGRYEGRAGNNAVDTDDEEAEGR